MRVNFEEIVLAKQTTEPIAMIAIDGPAASGKSTVGRLLAEQLHYLYLDTGCMYRAVTWAALQQEIDVEDETAVTQLAQEIQIEIFPVRTEEEDGRHYTVHVNGQDITWELRTPAVDTNVSLVSSYLGVRQEMVKRQRAFGQRGAVVMVAAISAPSSCPTHRSNCTSPPAPRNAPAAVPAIVKRRATAPITRTFWPTCSGAIKLTATGTFPPAPATDAILIDSTDRSPAEIVDTILQMIRESVISNQ